jgi:hypothetical protein
LLVQFEATTGDGVGEGEEAASGVPFKGDALALGDGDGDDVGGGDGDLYGIVATQQYV